MKITDNVELEANIFVTSSAQLPWLFGGDNKPGLIFPKPGKIAFL